MRKQPTKLYPHGFGISGVPGVHPGGVEVEVGVAVGVGLAVAVGVAVGVSVGVSVGGGPFTSGM